MSRTESLFRPLCGALILCAVIAVRPATAGEFHEAVHRGDLDTVRSLAQADPARVSLPDDSGAAPLHYAADGGHDELVVYLLDRGADIQAWDADGDAPLACAAGRGRDSTVALLLDRGAEIDAVGTEEFTALLYAVRGNHHSTARLLIERGADLEIPNDYGRTPLLWVARETGDYKMAVLLLDAGANIDAVDRFGTSGLELVAWRNFRALVDLFLDRGCAVAITGRNRRPFLESVTENGLDRLYFRSLEEGIEIDAGFESSGSWLHRAAKGGSAAIIADLVERGLDPSAVDDFGWCPLHYAASRGRSAAVELLLERGVDPSRRTKSGWTPCGLARAGRHEETGRILMARSPTGPDRVFPRLTGDYLGQGSPPSGGRLFAPDIVAIPNGGHSGVALSPGGDHLLFHQYTAVPDSGYWTGELYESRRVDGAWTEPKPAWFAQTGDDVAFFHPNGQRLFFMSRRPLGPDDSHGTEHIWVMDRVASGWSDPEPLPPAINDLRQHWMFSVAANGDLYFSSRRGPEQGVFVSRCVAGEYAEPEFLGIDGHTPFIAPDQEYLITLEFRDGGRANFIRFRQEDGAWSEAVDIRSVAGPEVSGMCPSVSPDGRAFFYLVDGVHWTSAEFIDELRKRS